MWLSEKWKRVLFARRHSVTLLSTLCFYPPLALLSWPSEDSLDSYKSSHFHRWELIRIYEINRAGKVVQWLRAIALWQRIDHNYKLYFYELIPKDLIKSIQWHVPPVNKWSVKQLKVTHLLHPSQDTLVPFLVLVTAACFPQRSSQCVTSFIEAFHTCAHWCSVWLLLSCQVSFLSHLDARIFFQHPATLIRIV